MSKKINNYVRFIFAIFVLVCACILTVCCKKHTHKYTETIVPSTCTEQGYTLHKCSCGSEYKDDYQEIKSHRYDKYGVCSACGATKQIEVRAYVDGVYSQSVYTDSNSRYKITAPNKPEDITSNPNSEKYFYGWFTDLNFQTPLTENTTFRSNAAIYAKWITVYSNNFKYTVSYGAATITGYVGGAPTVLVIPSYVNSFPVEAIGVDAFKNETVIKSVIICDGIETISGFNGCNSITYIKIPKSVKTIGEKCFSYCGFSSFNIPNNVIAIGDYAFDSCGRLTNVTIPNSVTSIGGYAFNNCSSLTNVTIPDSVTSINESAFMGCSSLTNITIPESVTSIDNFTFCNCSSLTYINIPKSVTSIGYSAFYGCSSLTNVTIPNSVTHIGSSAFENCISLTNVTIPDSVTSIDGDAFNGCSGLTNIEWNAENCKNNHSSYHIFVDCPNLSTITIGVNVKSIPNNIFYENKSPTNIYISDLSAWCSITGLCNLMCNGSSTKNLYLNNKLTKNLIIPDNVTSITNHAFAYTNLTAVTIRNGVTSINESAFMGCSSLTNITIPESVTSIDNFTFCNCSSLTYINIPNGVTSINEAAFWGCSSLTSITIPESVTSIDNYTFYNCSSLMYINIPNSVTSINESAFEGCSSLTNVTIPNSVTSINESAFDGCSSLTNITIPESVTHIRKYAFFNCSNLRQIVYKGTKSQWYKIIKDEYWKNSSQHIQVQCVDGLL